MLAATLAYLGKYLCDTFDIAPEELRVRMTDREHLLGLISSNKVKLKLPAISYGVDGIGLYMGPRTRGDYRGRPNITQTEADIFSPLPVKVNIRVGIICASELQSLDVISSYFNIAARSEFQGTMYYGGDKREAQPFECSIMEIEDLTTPVGLQESRSYEDAGSLYTLDGGFTLVTNLLFRKKTMKLVRSTHLDYSILDARGNPIPTKTITTESVSTFVTEA